MLVPLIMTLAGCSAAVRTPIVPASVTTAPATGTEGENLSMGATEAPSKLQGEGTLTASGKNSQILASERKENDVEQGQGQKESVSSSVSAEETDPASQLTNEQMLEQIRKTHYMGPSDGPYPVLHKGMDLWIEADLSKQRIYIKDGQRTIYTMLTSSGLDTIPDNSTPRGIFYTEKEKGTFFYNPQYHEGAMYWSSWKDHGIFLFHSVSTDEKGNIVVTEAEKLGHKASHGCFRLPVLDAKWIYENIPMHTKVVIHD